MRRTSFLIFIILLIGTSELYGQEKDSLVRDVDIVKGRTLDSITNAPIVGAFVIVKDSLGTFYTSTDEEGKFELTTKNINKDNIDLEVAILGYKLFKKTYSTKGKALDIGDIMMAEDSQEIDAATVKDRRLLFKNLGDTTVYFPTNIKVQEGATIKEALAKMPGIKIGAGGVEVMGKAVERTYVNGVLIFGDRAMTALENLDHKQVSKVKVYDEIDKEDAFLKGKNARKRRVMDINTFKTFAESINLSAAVGMGLEMDKGMDDKNGVRYLAGVKGGHYKDGRQLEVGLRSYNASGGGSSNVGISGVGGNNEINHAGDIKYNITLPKYLRLRLEYSYDDNRKKDKTVKHDEFFDMTTGDIDRFYYDTTVNNSINRNHKANFNINKRGRLHISTISGRVRFNDVTTNRSSGNKILKNDALLSQSTTDNKNNSKGISYSLGGSHQFRFSRTHGLTLNYNGSYDNSSSEQNRVEGTVDRAYNRYIFTTNDGEKLNLSGTITYRLNLNKAGTFSLSPNISYNKGYRHVLAADINTGDIDSTATRNETTNNFKQGIRLSYNVRLGDWYITSGLAWLNTELLRDEKFPEDVNWNMNYKELSPSLQVMYNKGMSDSFTLHYSSGANIPSFEQVNDKLTYINPLYLSTGNIDLNQSYMHDIMLRYINMIEGTQASFSVSAISYIETNVIGEKRIFYDESVYLPEYSYTTVPGAVLTTYDNIGTAYSAAINLGYSMPIWQLLPKVSLGYSYTKTPMSVENTVVNAIQQRPTLGMSLGSNMVNSPCDFSLDANTSYIDNKSPLGISDKAIRYSVNASFSADFLKRMNASVSSSYSSEYSYTYSKHRFSNVGLNASIGCRVFKDRKGMLSLECNDILNKTTPFTNTISAEKITNTWRTLNSRYIILTLSYRFSRQK